MPYTVVRRDFAARERVTTVARTSTMRYDSVTPASGRRWVSRPSRPRPEAGAP